MIIQDILREVGITGKELSLRLGINYNWYRRATMRSKKEKPNWVKSFELGYEMGAEKKIDPSGVCDGGLVSGVGGGASHSAAVGRESVVDCDKCVYEVLKDGECILVLPCSAHIGELNDYFK